MKSSKLACSKQQNRSQSCNPSSNIDGGGLAVQRQVRPPVTVRASRVIFPILPTRHTVWTASDAHAMPPAAQQGRVQQAGHPTVSHEVAVCLLEHQFFYHSFAHGKTKVLGLSGMDRSSSHIDINHAELIMAYLHCYEPGSKVTHAFGCRL